MVFVAKGSVEDGALKFNNGEGGKRRLGGMPPHATKSQNLVALG